MNNQNLFASILASSIHEWEISEYVFDSVSIFLDIIEIEETKSISISASAHPFYDEKWKEYHLIIDTPYNIVSKYSSIISSDEIENTKLQLALHTLETIAKILTAEGHEVFTCKEKDLHKKDYSHFSKQKKKDIDIMRINLEGMADKEK